MILSLSSNQQLKILYFYFKAFCICKQKQSQKLTIRYLQVQQNLFTELIKFQSISQENLKIWLVLRLMRFTVYFLTFFTYATVHMMRMTYSFNKHNIETTFKISDLILGLLDSLMFIALSIGTLLRYQLMTDKRLALICLKTAIVVSLAYAVLPMYALLKGESIQTNASSWTYILLFATLAIFGFFQFSFFPSLITIFSHHFNVKRDGSLVGIWSSKSNVGNIIGFFLSNFMVYQLGLRWQVTMITCSIIHLCLGILLQRFVVESDDDSQEQITTSELFQFLKEKWQHTQFKLYILSFSFFKAILYSYELWTPQFLVDMGFKQYSGYVPMVFDISTLIGSYVMGRLYEDDSINESEQESKTFLQTIKSFKFTVASVMIMIASLFYFIVQPNIYLYFGLGILMGIFLGGVYNSLQNCQILAYAKNDPRQTDLLSTINIGLACALVGLMQLIIGVVIYIGTNRSHGLNNIEDGLHEKHQHKLIYLVLVVLAIIAMGLSWARVHFLKKDSQKQQSLKRYSKGTSLQVQE